MTNNVMKMRNQFGSVFMIIAGIAIIAFMIHWKIQKSKLPYYVGHKGIVTKSEPENKRIYVSYTVDGTEYVKKYKYQKNFDIEKIPPENAEVEVVTSSDEPDNPVSVAFPVIAVKDTTGKEEKKKETRAEVYGFISGIVCLLLGIYMFVTSK